MMTAPTSWPKRILRLPSRNFHWVAASSGVLASLFCGAYLLSHPLGTALTAPSSAESAAAQNSIAHLPGVSGTTFAAMSLELKGDEIIVDERGAPQMTSPVAWNELSGPGCLTVTTENGNKLSFRIHGYRPASKPDGSKPGPAFDLAVRACTQTGDGIVNAVIEPDAADTGRDPVASERSL